MKKLACIFILISSFTYSVADEVLNSSPLGPQDTALNPTENNITWGLFFGLTLGVDFIKNYPNTDTNLTSYNYSKDGTEAGKYPSFNGINTEAKIGLIKTTKNFGFRMYGYYGRGWDSMESFGLDYTPLNADGYYENAYLDTEYYGGMIDLLFGAFQDSGITGYFSIGGGYQFTNYKLSGKIGLGYKNNSFLDDDIYNASLSGTKFIQSPVANVGMGFLISKHHLFEINLRYLFINPVFVSESQTNLVGTAGSSVYQKTIPDNTPIMIKQTIGYNMNLTFNYMYKF